VESVVTWVVEVLFSGLRDWRIGFVHGATWVIIARLKCLWGHTPPRWRRRYNELLAFILAGGLTLWVYAGDEYMWPTAVAWGLFNPVIYKLVVNTLFHYHQTRWIVEGLKTFKEAHNGTVRQD
jgi:hypothetical protein